MVVSKEEVIEVALDTCPDTQVSTEDQHGVSYLIIDSWSDLGKINDALNKAFNLPNWATARRVYATAGAARSLADHARNPGAHPSNFGPCGGPFASLRTHNGELTLDAALSNQAPSLLPDTVLAIDEREDIEVVFSDDHTLCDNCQVILELQPSSYTWTPQFKLTADDELLCLGCSEEG